MAKTTTPPENPAPPALMDNIRGMAQTGPAQLAQDGAGYGDALKAAMPELVKGAGFAPKGGNAPLTDQADIMARSIQATVDLRATTWEGFTSKSSVVRKMSPVFLNKYGALRAALSAPSVGEQMQAFMNAVASPDVVRSFSAGNLGIGSVYGLVPFNLNGVLAS